MVGGRHCQWVVVIVCQDSAESSARVPVSGREIHFTFCKEEGNLETMSLCAIAAVAAGLFQPWGSVPVCGCVRIVCDLLFLVQACTALLLLEDTSKSSCPEPVLILIAVTPRGHWCRRLHLLTFLLVFTLLIRKLKSILCHYAAVVLNT